MLDKLMEEFQKACRALALEEAGHKARRAKAEADQAELILEATREAIERARKENGELDDILDLKMGGN